jgi:hypothetical protein
MQIERAVSLNDAFNCIFCHGRFISAINLSRLTNRVRKQGDRKVEVTRICTYSLFSKKKLAFYVIAICSADYKVINITVNIFWNLSKRAKRGSTNLEIFNNVFNIEFQISE